MKLTNVQSVSDMNTEYRVQQYKQLFLMNKEEKKERYIPQN